MTFSGTEHTALVDVVMPQMGTSVAEGTVIGWKKAVGDQIAVDETLCEVSSDKIDVECPSPVTGTVAELVAGVGGTVPIGAVIARITPAPTAPKVAEPPIESPDPLPVSATVTPMSESTGDCRAAQRVSPVVARIVAQHGLDLAMIKGSGRNGRITRRDALAAAKSAEPALEPPLHSDSPYLRGQPATPGLTPVLPRPHDVASSSDFGGTTSKLTRMRQRIGAAMLRSQATAATCHTVVECDMTAVERRRSELGITALPLVARGVIDTLRDFPDLNATLEGETITRYQRVHLGIAVSLGQDGLIVPVIHDAQNLAAEGLSSVIRDLAARARAKQLLPDEARGATFTITNPGAYGAVLATPVLDTPRVGILDVEAVVRRPIVVSDAGGGESIAIRSMVNLILGWDHRAMDGAYAARFLAALRGRLES